MFTVQAQEGDCPGVYPGNALEHGKLTSSLWASFFSLAQLGYNL